MELQLDYNGNKAFRLLTIYERLNKGEELNKSTLAENFGVTLKTIQRDIDDLRAYLTQTHFEEGEVSIKYDKRKNTYYLARLEREWLTNQEILGVAKIILESRAFKKSELKQIIDKLLSQVTPKDKDRVGAIVKNEYGNYIELQHSKEILSPMWELSQYIISQEIVSFEYMRKDGVRKTHLVKPVAIMFSEYYFYLICYMADDSKKYPTVFRIDRVLNIKSTKKKFNIPYKDKFSDTEFRKRVQFMFSGELKRVTFEYSGPSIEAVLDRLPTAEILKLENGVYTIKVEAYGDGINMWLRSQGDSVRVV